MKNLLLMAAMSILSASAFSAEMDFSGMSLKELDTMAREGIVASYKSEGIALAKKKIDKNADSLSVEPVSADILQVSMSFGINYVRDADDGVADYCTVDFKITSLGKIAETAVDCGKYD